MSHLLLLFHPLSLFDTQEQLCSFLGSICDNDPVSVPNNTKGIYDWDLTSRTFETSITYSCPLQGWGFPADGSNSLINFCQSDKRWNLTSIDSCVCKYTFSKSLVTKKKGRYKHDKVIELANLKAIGIRLKRKYVIFV